LSASTYLISFPWRVLIMLYRKNHNLPAQSGFYQSSNSTSTLCMHFTHEGGEHYKFYHEMCKKNNIPAVAKSPNVAEGDSCSVQSNISSFLASPAPLWHREGLLLHLCEWIVLDDQVCLLLSTISYMLISSFSHSLLLRRSRLRLCSTISGHP